MFGPPLEPDWVDDEEWEGIFCIEFCETEVDSHPEGTNCSDYCDEYHLCGFGGDIEATFITGRSGGTAYYTCPDCKTEYSSDFDRDY
jgi:hypothetical protein